MDGQKEIYSKEHFPKIFEDYREKIFNLAYKMTADKNNAEDITQETFLKCHENLEKFRGDSHIFTWLYTITKNISLRFLEKQKKSSPKELEQLLKTASNDQIERFETKEKNNYINQVKEGCLLGLLKTLSFNQRISFILYVLHKHSIADTAKVVNKSESATRTLIHRARKNIKIFLCNNCFLYDIKNSCRCENMINFSLKQGWIKHQDIYSNDLPKTIESELNDFQRISELFLNLPNHKLSDAVSKSIKNNDFLIFSEKKVK